MQTKKITLNGIKHQVYFWGKENKPKLFFLHGWLDTGASFQFVCDELQKDFFCIAPDLRGYGKSAHTSNPLGYFFYEYIADIACLFDYFSSQKPVRLVGHSLGGHLASMYAGTYPHRLSHLANLEGFGVTDHSESEAPLKLRQWLESKTGKGFHIYPSSEAFALRLVANNPRLTLDRAKKITPFLCKKMKGGYQMAADFKHRMPNPHLFQMNQIIPFWEAISAKCLLLMGESTEMRAWIKTHHSLKEEITRRLKHFPKGSPLVTLKGCGHMMHLEKPKELAQIILDFVKD